MFSNNFIFRHIESLFILVNITPIHCRNVNKQFGSANYRVLFLNPVYLIMTPLLTLNAICAPSIFLSYSWLPSQMLAFTYAIFMRGFWRIFHVAYDAFHAQLKSFGKICLCQNMWKSQKSGLWYLGRNFLNAINNKTRTHTEISFPN